LKAASRAIEFVLDMARLDTSIRRNARGICRRCRVPRAGRSPGRHCPVPRRNQQPPPPCLLHFRQI